MRAIPQGPKLQCRLSKDGQEIILGHKSLGVGGLTRFGHARHIVLRPSPIGLDLVMTEQYVRDAFGNAETITYTAHHPIPGEMPFADVVRFIARETGANLISRNEIPEQLTEEAYKALCWNTRKREIGTLLRSSGIWDKRGYFDTKHEVPKAFWKSVPMTTMACYANPRAWWRDEMAYALFHYLNDNNKSKIIARATVDKLIEEGFLPEVPWAVRKWNKMPYEDLKEFIVSGMTKSPQWATYLEHCYEYNDVFKRHNVFKGYSPGGNADLNEFIPTLLQWPRGKQSIDTLNSAFNAGMNLHAIATLNPASPAKLRDYIEGWRVLNKIHQGIQSLDARYQPPDLAVPGNHHWVDYSEFYTLSDAMNCCISHSPGYAKKMIAGRAHVAYRPAEGDDRGSLAFIAYDDSSAKWYVQEHRAKHNNDVSKTDKDAMEVLCRTMNALKIQPGTPIPKVEKTLEEIDTLHPTIPEIRDLFAAAQNRDHYDHSSMREHLPWELDKDYNWVRKAQPTTLEAQAQGTETQREMALQR